MHALLVAGTHSGVGKTSISLGLTRALARRGLRVQPFKVGPDYLDPTHLRLAAGRACYNLDGWMGGLDYSRRLFAARTADADAALIEGVMGLYDGATPGGLDGSSAEIALLTGAPVVLVVDVSGQAGSVAAVVRGFVMHESRLAFAGVIANRCGSERHAQIIRDALAAHDLPPLLGWLTKDALPSLPSRHLGLVSASDSAKDEARLEALADAVERSVDLDALLTRCDVPRPQAVTLFEETTKSRPRVRLGVARDAAFHFLYEDGLEALVAAGAEIVPFSPLADDRLPAIDALYLCGGYPEAHAAQLAANAPMREAIRTFCASGRVVYAECGGLMLLAEALIDLEGRAHPMCGVLPATALMQSKRHRLGLVEAVLRDDCLWGRAGERLRGHEFHYSTLDLAPTGAWRYAYDIENRRGSREAGGWRRDNVLAGYPHLHWASRPQAVEHFLATCRSAS